MPLALEERDAPLLFRECIDGMRDDGGAEEEEGLDDDSMNKLPLDGGVLVTEELVRCINFDIAVHTPNN